MVQCYVLSFTYNAVCETCLYLAGLSAGHRSGHRSGYRSQVRLQATGQVTGQTTGHRSDHRSHTKTIGHWTKLFLIDILLYKNKTSQGT